jgi:hypothetical protein
VPFELADGNTDPAANEAPMKQLLDSNSSNLSIEPRAWYNLRAI